MNPEYLQLGAVAIIFLVAIREFFAYLKSKKNSGVDKQTLEQLTLLNENHLHDIGDKLDGGFDRVVNAINSGNMKQIELLGEIKGALSKIK